MDIWKNSIINALGDNEKNTAYYENYKKSYEELIVNLKLYNDAFSPNIMVPICNRILMPGNLIHTNEILVSIGCNYFVKTSSKQAQNICERRLKEVDEILKNLEKENEFLTNQIEFTAENVLEQPYEEIIEDYDEEADKQWRIQHRKNMANYKKKEREETIKIDGNQFMEKLDILELEEDLDFSNEHDSKESKIKHLREKLVECKSRVKTTCTTEEDLFKRLDELEEVEELEDELRMLRDSDDDSTPSEVSTDSDDEVIDHIDDYEASDPPKIKNKGKRVSFATENLIQAKTIDEITFNASDGESSSVTKPIIKNCERVAEETHIPEVISESPPPVVERQTIVIGDIIEKNDPPLSEPSQAPARQMSKFKAMRMKNKE